MIRGGLVVALALAGCPGGGTSTGGAGGSGAAVPGPDLAGSAGSDARAISEDERLAMIQAAMNQLSPVANQCWAAGAVDDYLLKGTVTLQIAPQSTGDARVEVVHDTTDDKVLTRCMATVVAAYQWPRELAGEVIELPFAFDAPDGQFVIDRRLVPISGQAGVGVAVLLDEKNSNNPAATMLELTFKDGAELAMAKSDRHEIWYVTAGAGAVAGPDKKAVELAPGAVIDVAAGGYRAVTAGGAGMSAVVFLVPGQIEGVARGGAMPGERLGAGTVRGKPPAPRVITAHQTFTADKRVVDIYLDSAAKGAARDVALSVLALDAGAAVPEHVHAGESEYLYVMAGAGSMVIDGVTLPVTDSTVIQIPKGIKHQATVTTAMRAIQLYTPGGPEQRFKK